MVSADKISASLRSPPSARKWLESVMPGRRGGMAAMTGIIGGKAIVASTKPVQTKAAWKRQQPSGEQGEDRQRRRKGAAQIVEHFPAADRREGGRRFGRRRPAWARARKSTAGAASRRAPSDGGASAPTS